LDNHWIFICLTNRFYRGGWPKPEKNTLQAPASLLNATVLESFSRSWWVKSASLYKKNGQTIGVSKGAMRQELFGYYSTRPC
jgi:hypothetical protein